MLPLRGGLEQALEQAVRGLLLESTRLAAERTLPTLPDWTVTATLYFEIAFVFMIIGFWFRLNNDFFVMTVQIYDSGKMRFSDFSLFFRFFLFLSQR